MEPLLPALRLVCWTVVLGAVLPQLARRSRRASGVDDVGIGALSASLAAFVLAGGGPLRPVPTAALACAMAVAFAGRRPRGSLRRRALLFLARQVDRAVRSAPPQAPGAPPSVAAAFGRHLALVLGWGRAVLTRIRSRHARGGLVVACAAGAGLAATALPRTLPPRLEPSRLQRALDAAAGAPVTAHALTAPTIVVAAWSGAALGRRYLPHAPWWSGAVAVGVPCSAALLRGYLSHRDLLIAVAALWGIAPRAAGAPSWRRWSWVAAASVVDLSGGCLLGALLVAHDIARGPASVVEPSRRTLAAMAVCAATLLSLSIRAGASRASVGPATLALGAAGGAWLLAVCWRGRWRPRRASHVVLGAAAVVLGPTAWLDAHMRATPAPAVALLAGVAALGIAAHDALATARVDAAGEGRQRRRRVTTWPALTRT